MCACQVTTRLAGIDFLIFVFNRPIIHLCHVTVANMVLGSDYHDSLCLQFARTTQLDHTRFNAGMCATSQHMYTHCVIRADAPSLFSVSRIRFSNLAFRRAWDASFICWSFSRSRSISAFSATSSRVVSCTVLSTSLPGIPAKQHRPTN